ncbi:TonB family protein [Methylobacterium haplocladii]|uniref:TonB C-terminal domain-containing protein n=1 Tax=Methylobacterium haplocladii TaxID=1176176 RepID=A0A512IKC9_9HYPH|nr:TonB family protein [Methylobacterium haplocladii]GEO98159.1 hypothetical protein MHA02_05470 [Methylobacterium haplocladii]GLS58595.1 hypothetical protein GCM10007887_12590 [Methylobacterium haplocladii]
MIVLAALIGAPSDGEARPAAGVPERERRTEKLTPNRWVAMVVTRITQAGGTTAAGDPGGTVTIRVRIGIDGTLEGAAVEESSGSPALDGRALEAAKAAAPFAPPPEKLLTLEGFTELSFSVEFARSGTARP